ncbi:MAG: sigma-54-dependent Fis family transcriptional regulator [Verrucomicrobia bacterium]|nr:sigma-54-dependent Fis family transcriptional regulator [Verrucomicrobiota bacterium]
MNSSPAKILLVEDDPAIVVTLHRVLAGEGYDVSIEKTGDSGLARAKESPVDLVITDLKLPGISGLELVRELHAARPRLPILMITAHGTTETAIEATQAGAYDYLLKPFDIPELLKLVQAAVSASRLMSEPVQLGRAGQSHDAIVGNSRAMQNIYKEIGRVAAKPVGVLIRGETGTGKELIARAIYQHSDRANEPFVAINCAAIPETLLESELFGHERGAFTGAESRRIGRFEQADHGTIFLDEIGDMTPGTQVKLMRVLQEKCLQRLGGKETIPIDVRVIAATHRDLESSIKQNLFREDLFYRISVVVLNLPPLRERKEDIPDLVRFFLHKYAAEFSADNTAIHPDAIEFLQSQSWPGNVRELENVSRKMLLLAQGYTISLEHVRAALAKISLPTASAEKTLQAYADELLAAAQRGDLSDAYARLHETTERVLISRAIELAHNNQARAARWLGISRLTLREKLIQFGLHPNQETVVQTDSAAQPPSPVPAK